MYVGERELLYLDEIDEFEDGGEVGAGERRAHVRVHVQHSLDQVRHALSRRHTLHTVRHHSVRMREMTM